MTTGWVASLRKPHVLRVFHAMLNSPVCFSPFTGQIHPVFVGGHERVIFAKQWHYQPHHQLQHWHPPPLNEKMRHPDESKPPSRFKRLWHKQSYTCCCCCCGSESRGLCAPPPQALFEQVFEIFRIIASRTGSVTSQTFVIKHRKGTIYQRRLVFIFFKFL